MHKFTKDRSCQKWLQGKQGNGMAWFYSNGTKPGHIRSNPGSIETYVKKLPGKPIKTAAAFLTKHQTGKENNY